MLCFTGFSCFCNATCTFCFIFIRSFRTPSYFANTSTFVLEIVFYRNSFYFEKDVIMVVHDSVFSLLCRKLFMSISASRGKLSLSRPRATFSKSLLKLQLVVSLLRLNRFWEYDALERNLRKKTQLVGCNYSSVTESCCIRLVFKLQKNKKKNHSQLIQKFKP